MTEEQIRAFWQANPCGEALVGGLQGEDDDTIEKFFEKYDNFRYSECPQILKILDRIPIQGKRVLEIGLGEGADSEQLIRRGAVYSGLDLTKESVSRVGKRFSLHGCPYVDLKQGSALHIPYPSNSFDIVFSHGVLMCIPEIDRAQREIARVLKPHGELIAMVYAKWSLNYLLSIAVLRRLGLIAMYCLGVKGGGKFSGHVENARRAGLWNYLRLKNFIHKNTDGPNNPYSIVYDKREVGRVFTDFTLTKAYKVFMHAPPLPARIIHRLPGESLLGWFLWVHLKPKNRL
jgi:SAM-dependent methyltransferase